MWGTLKKQFARCPEYPREVRCVAKVVSHSPSWPRLPMAPAGPGFPWPQHPSEVRCAPKVVSQVAWCCFPWPGFDRNTHYSRIQGHTSAKKPHALHVRTQQPRRRKGWNLHRLHQNVARNSQIAIQKRTRSQRSLTKDQF